MQCNDDSESSEPRPSGSRVGYVVSEELAKISSLLPSNRNRSLLVHSLVTALGLFKAVDPGGRKCIQVLRPRKATTKELLTYHTRDYLKYALSPSSDYQDQCQVAEFGLEDDCPPFRNMHEYIQLVAGATLTAVDALKSDVCDIAICWDGGRHHAQKAKASGFCYVADCILAILSLKRPIPSLPMRRPRVMYVDLDLHFSDAVSQAFYNASSAVSSQILTLSIHHASPGFFPVSALSGLPNPDDPAFDPFTLSIPLKPGASGRTFARIWPIVECIKDIFNPDMIVVECGLDGLAGDPMATWNWSLGGVGSLGWCITRILHDWDGKKLLLGGGTLHALLFFPPGKKIKSLIQGGYNSTNASRAWTFLTSVAIGKPLPLETDIPDHRALPLYQPSFTLDVPSGNMQDQNSEDYLRDVEQCYRRVQMLLEHRLS